MGCRASRGTLFLALSLLSACTESDPVDPCARDLACAVAGVDIAILDVEPRWSADQDYDAAIDMRVVQPGDEIEVEVALMNRGTIDSSDDATLVGLLPLDDRTLRAETTVEPLDVGERATYTLVFEVPSGPRWRTWHMDELDPAGEFRLHYDDYVDADTANDHRAGFEFHVDAPVLELSVTGMPDTMRTQTSYPVTLHVTNHSETRAFGGGLEIEFCALTDVFDSPYCTAGLVETFSPMTIGPVPAGATRELDAIVRSSKDAVWWFDSYTQATLAPCVPNGAEARDCMLPADFDPSNDYPVTIIPDLIADCDAPEVVDGASIDVADVLCDHDIDVARTYAVAWFEAEAGECWRASFTTASSGSIRMRDAWGLDFLDSNAVDDCRVVTRPGPQLLIVAPATPGAAPSGTVLLERIV